METSEYKRTALLLKVIWCATRVNNRFHVDRWNRRFRLLCSDLSEIVCDSDDPFSVALTLSAAVPFNVSVTEWSLLIAAVSFWSVLLWFDIFDELVSLTRRDKRNRFLGIESARRTSLFFSFCMVASLAAHAIDVPCSVWSAAFGVDFSLGIIHRSPYFYPTNEDYYNIQMLTLRHWIQTRWPYRCSRTN